MTTRETRIAVIDAVRSAFGKQGMQVKRKDKDLMDDTGGGSKSRKYDPKVRAPREEERSYHRTKTKTTEKRDVDTDSDKDTSSDKDVRAK